MQRRRFLKLTMATMGSAAAGAGAGVRPATGAVAPTPVAGAPDVAVIGAGAFGSWTAFYLRQMGARVKLVDAYGPGNSRSSSGGETRLIRADHGERSVYTELALKAFDLWDRWEEEWGSDLFVPTGRLIMTSPRGEGILQERQAILREYGFESELLDHDELRYRYPQLNVDGISEGLYDSRSGLLRARRACQVVVEQFLRDGGEFQVASASPGAADNGAMQSVGLGGNGSLSAGTYIFACGPWLGRLFPQLMGDRLRTPRRDVLFFGIPAGDDRFSYPNLPTWGFTGPSDDPDFSTWYGFPDVDGRGLKACPVNERNEFDADADERLVNPYQARRTREFVNRRFPDMGGQPITESRVCQVENSIDGNFIVARHPDYSNVWLAGGGSGHGFKHGPALGEYIARRVLNGDGDPELDETFRLKTETF